MAETPITLIICIATGLVSWRAFENTSLLQKLLHHPYSVKHKREYYRLVSHALVHSGGLHLFFNLFVFYSFGRAIEMIFKIKYGEGTGSLLFIALYVLGVVVAAAPSMRKHADDYSYSAVGASGGVSAVLMAFMIMNPTAQIAFFFFIPMPAFLAVFVFFILERLMEKSGRTNIAHDAHIWGALFGIAFITLLDVNYLVDFIRQVREYFSSLFS